MRVIDTLSYLLFTVENMPGTQRERSFTYGVAYFALLCDSWRALQEITGASGIYGQLDAASQNVTQHTCNRRAIPDFRILRRLERWNGLRMGALPAVEKFVLEKVRDFSKDRRATCLESENFTRLALRIWSSGYNMRRYTINIPAAYSRNFTENIMIGPIASVAQANDVNRIARGTVQIHTVRCPALCKMML